MARKSNKTSHVLHLLAGEEPVPETPEEKKETEETKEPAGAAEKESPAEGTLTPLGSFGQARPEEEMPSISIISTGNSEDDPVADLIKGQLEEDFPEDILTPQAESDTTDISADSDAPGTVERTTDSHTPDITDTSADDNNPAAAAVDSSISDTAGGDGPVPAAAAADNSISDNTDTPAGGDEPGTAATAADSNISDNTDTPAGGDEPDTAAAAADSNISDNTDTPAGGDEPGTAAAAADSSISDIDDIPADSNAGGSDTVGHTEQSQPGTQATATPTVTAETETEGSTAVQSDNIPADDAAAAVKSEDPSDPAAATPTASSPDRPPLTPEHLDSILYPVDGNHLQNYRFVNVMEYIVKDIAIDYMKKFDMCTCERCVVDTIALTLTYCNAKYIVVDSHSVSPLLNFYSNRYLGDVTVELTKACIKIKENPRH